MKIRIYSLLLFCCITTCSFSQDAIQNYKNGKYTESLQGFMALIQQGAKGEDLYFNIGNTYTQLGDYSHAILYYEKALRWNPQCQPCIDNKKIAEKNAEVENYELPKFFMLLFLDKLAFNFKDTSWLVAGLFSLCLFVIWHFKKIYPEYLKYLYIIFSIFFLCLSLRVNRYRFSDDEYILMNKNNIHISPDDKSEIKIQLNAGTKVYKLDKIENWFKIRTASYEEGWVEMKDLEMISL